MVILHYPDYSQHPSVLRINLSPSQRNTLRLQEFKVICSGPHSKTFLVKFQAKSDAKLWSHNSCFFRWVCHDPLTGRKSASWITFGLFVCVFFRIRQML